MLKAECIHFGLGRARDKLSRLADSGKLSYVSDRVRSKMMHDAGRLWHLAKQRLVYRGSLSYMED